MKIDVSKLKKGDQYYNQAEGWVVVGDVKRMSDGTFKVFDTDNRILNVSATGVGCCGLGRWSVTDTKVFNEGSPASNSPIKSDGGSSGYYTMPKELFDAITDRGEVEVEDIIKYGLGNDFDFGNLFKSLYRLYGLSVGGGKEGNSVGYECNKILYSLEKIRKAQSKIDIANEYVNIAATPTGEAL